MPLIERIVLVDDNDADNEYHEIIIRRAGFGGQIVAIGRGPDALKFVENADLEKQTIIFLDINMPIMNGFQVAESAAPLLRDKPAIAVFILSSSDSEADRARAGELEVVRGYICKPLTVARVREMLAQAS